MKIVFDWDPSKAEENLKKHKVSFEEAKTIFFNFPIEVFHDPEHSESEDRFIAFGFSEKERVLLVVHMENATGSRIRIISARKATKKEISSVFGS